MKQMIKIRFKQMIAITLATVMLFGECVTGYAAKSETENILPEDIVMTEDMKKDFLQTPEKEPEEQAEVLFELDELREQSGKQFRLSDGTILAAQYGMDVHYEAEDGSMKEIDNRFLYETAETTEDFAGYRTAEGAVEYKFAPQVQEGELLTVSEGEYSVGFELLAPTDEESEIPQLTPEELQPIVPTVEILPQPTNEVAAMSISENDTKLAESPLMFLKGEVLNATELPKDMQLVETENGILKVELVKEQPEVMEAGMMSEKEKADEKQSGLSEETSEDVKVIWTDVSDAMPETENAELLEEIKADQAVTSVGYGNVLPGVSLQYVIAGSTLKEYILVNQKQESYNYEFLLNLENLVPEQLENGSILLKDEKSGEAVYEIPAGYMQDALGEVSEAVSMEIVQDKDNPGEWIFTVTADVEWINAEERVFPVQIDPTLNRVLNSTATQVKAVYVEGADGRKNFCNENTGNLMIGYDSYKSKQLRTYIQLQNLPELPKDSVICGAVCNFWVMDLFSDVAHPTLNVAAKKVTSSLSAMQSFTWYTQPAVDSQVMDCRTLNEDVHSAYLSWNITELIKEHYKEEKNVSAFMLAAYDEISMKDSYCAKGVLRFINANVYPMLQIMYRDTKGIEGYYTYQTHNHGNAGVAYVSDYNSQLTVVKPVASYESTVQSYGISLVFNSAFSDRRFTNDSKNLHTEDFLEMKSGYGWKLSLQETVVETTVEDVKVENNTLVTDSTEWLIYNDSDGTEHYFQKSKEDSSKYEDEDGLGLTITKSGTTGGNTIFTMTDKKDNQKIFTNGYLTKVIDGNGNSIHIIYGNGTVDNNIPSTDGKDQITSVWKVLKGNTGAEKIFTLTYDTSERLIAIEETYGDSYKIEYENTNYLKYISVYDSVAKAYVIQAKYGYDDAKNLSYIVDAETNQGTYYKYEPSATGYKVTYWREYAGNADSNRGREVMVVSDDLRRTTYCDYGTDRIKDPEPQPNDDIYTTYLFNSCGQTVNVSTTDAKGNFIGATASAYTKNQGTEGTNNRVTENASVGYTAVNLLSNGSFEQCENGTATGWSPVPSTDFVACRSLVTEPKKANPHGGAANCNLYWENTGGTPSIYTSYTLEAGVTYTVSAYANTRGVDKFGNDAGVYLKITDKDGNELERGTEISYWTDVNIDNGWQRIFVTYTPEAKIENARIYVVSEYIKGTVRVDEVQLEEAETPATYNYVTNNSFENGTTGWKVSRLDWGEGEEADYSGKKEVHGNESFTTKGNPNGYYYAQQEIPVYKSGATTFHLSGWSRADSIPDLEEKNEFLTDRFWGITAKVCYTDETDDTDEKFHLAFNEFVEDWQYGAVTIVPTHPELTIREIVVRAVYSFNANGAWFDMISLTEEPVQTYFYDEEGKIKSAKEGSTKEEYSYDTGTENLIKISVPGNGAYTYEYNNANEHLPTKVTNDTASMDIEYTSYGEAKKTTLKDNTTTSKPLNMTSSATYSNGLLMTQTDNTGGTTSYSYNGDRELFSVKDAKNRTVETYQDNIWNRVDRTYQSGVIAANFGYSNGHLGSITRGGYLAQGQTTKYNQIYGFTYDAFGNRKTATLKGETRNKENNALLGSSTTTTLATYDYNAGNGTLKSMTYGPDSGYTPKASYTYDSLDRLKTVHYSDSNITYGYQYNSEGDLAGITVNGTPTYSYTYDSLGRLIYSAKLSNKQPILYTLHQYDTADRLSGQGWQINGQGFAEKYTYNDNDGTLTKIQYVDGDTISDGADNLSFTYNKIKQLTKRTSPKLDTAYSYRVLNSTNNTVTNQVASIVHTLKGTGNTTLPTLAYTYDAVGNIKTVKSGSTTTATYTYDNQYQLTKEVLNIQSQNGLTQTSNYTFDTFGNLRSKSYSRSDGLSGTYTFTYGNTAWQDQLTKVQRTDSSGANVSGNIYYDAVGNPTTYFNGKKNWTFTWQNGRQLATAEITGSGNEITNTYDVDGIRETKTVGGVTHTYTTLDGKVVREAYGNVKVDYLYDNTGRPYKLIVTEGTTKYTGFYILNLQGDVIGIVDTSGAKAVTYEYSAWGTLIGNSTNGSTNGSKLNQYNALKYRGYYYDADLAMYYLGSRFYDTEICRFINADDLDYLGTSGDFIGYNLYAYCANNPVNCKDEDGNAAILASLGIIAASGVVGCLVGAFTTAITGGDMIEGAIKGGITGAIGATVGVFKLPLLAAAVGGGATDFVMQSIPLYKANGTVDLLQISWLDVGLTAIETTLGAWVPAAQYPNTDVMNVGHTINSWTRASLVIGWGDVVVRNGLSVVTPKSVGNFANGNAGQSGTTCRIPTGMTTADYFRQCYSNY